MTRLNREPDLLTVSEVAALLRVSQRGVRKLSSDARIPKPIRIGRLLRWRSVEIRRLIAGDGSRSAAS